VQLVELFPVDKGEPIEILRAWLRSPALRAATISSGANVRPVIGDVLGTGEGQGGAADLDRKRHALRRGQGAVAIESLACRSRSRRAARADQLADGSGEG
jgi:hypothetical protein